MGYGYRSRRSSYSYKERQSFKAGIRAAKRVSYARRSYRRSTYGYRSRRY